MERIRQMIRSMTGYGSAEGEVQAKHLYVDFKAVNHRYFNFFAKLPQDLAPLETNIQALAKEHLSRGQISVFASWNRAGGAQQEPRINKRAAGGVIKALKELKEEFGLEGGIELSHLLGFGELFSQSELDMTADELWAAVKPIFEEALRDLDALRLREGSDLHADLLDRLELFEGLVSEVGEHRPQIIAEQRSRFEKRIVELAPDGVDVNAIADRVALEVALFADRADISEEITRLNSHLDKFRELLDTEGAVGRKIDFLIQEMNRETNTIGSKSPDAAAARVVVEMKAELEKIREQVQNIE